MILLTMTSSLFAQDITNKLGASGNYEITDSNGYLLMRLQSDAGVYFGSPYAGTGGTIPMEGIGTRMMWHPNKSAFRAGYVDGTQWNDANIGTYSIAIGRNTIASGLNSVSIGFSNTASGDYSTAFGYSTNASGGSSTAMGRSSIASGSYSTAMGFSTTASGSESMAVGRYTTASGDQATAMGFGTTASGDYSTAMGYSVSTNGMAGSFIIGDHSTSTTSNSSAANELTMRFAGGYRLFTNFATNLGVSLGNGDTSWGTLSDSTRKENFQQADGEYFLNSIKELKLGSWNYKTQDSSIRHYGPMAQEIFNYFGKDDFGTIGNDTTLATADMDGIMMIAIQALINKNTELENEISELKQKILKVEATKD